MPATTSPSSRPGSRARARRAVALVTIVAALVAVACSSDDTGDGATDTTHDAHGISTGPVESSVSIVATTASTTPPPTTAGMPFTGRPLIAGMPPLLDPTNVYSATTTGLTDAAKSARELVYVPHNDSNDVWVIDPATYTVIDKYATGRIVQHVVPSWDTKTLYANNNAGNTLTAIDPKTGKAIDTFPIDAPYNLYFTPDGKFALVMEERNKIIAWRDATTPRLDVVKKLPVPCLGVNHADFSIDGTYFIASCEFSGELLKIDTLSQEVVGKILLPKSGAMPQDTRLTPDGHFFLIADMKSNGVWEVDGESFTVTRFIPTGRGAHGIYPSRDTSVLFITNRDEGSISVMDSATREVRSTWKIPGGGSPDMGGITADGTEFWVSGRYHNEVYVIDVADPADLKLVTKIPVGRGPHGLAVWPQPGRYSLGHTGNMR